MRGRQSVPNPEELHQHAQLTLCSDAAALPHLRQALTGEGSPEGVPMNGAHTPAPVHTHANQNWRERQPRTLAPEMLTAEIDPEMFARGPTSSLEAPAEKAEEKPRVQMNLRSDPQCWKRFSSGLRDWSQYPAR